MMRRALMALAVLAATITPTTAQTPALDMGAVTTAAPSYLTNTNRPLSLDTSGNLRTLSTPSSSTAAGITPVVSGVAESSHVLKASAGNLYGVYATNQTATAGFLMVFNLASAPVDGAVTPLACVPIAASTNGGVASINYNPGPPAVYSTGITAVVSSAATCFTKTTGVITAYIAGQIQ